MGRVAVQVGKIDVQEFHIKNTSLVPLAWRLDASELQGIEVGTLSICSNAGVDARGSHCL